MTAVDAAAYESLPSTTATATPSAQVTMHVESITVNPPIQSGKNYKASGTVSVVSSAHAALPSAAVTAEWWFNSGTSSLLQTQTVTTDSNGAAVFTSPPVKATSGASFTLRITGVVLSGYLFNPSEGVPEDTSSPIP